MSQNPYEAPRYDATLSSVTYYQLVSTRLSLREYRRISKNWLELVLGVCLKFLRIRTPMMFALADPGQFHRIAPHDLSVRARENIKPMADQALALNLKYLFSYALPTVGTIEGAAATFLSEDGRSILLIAYARAWSGQTVDEKTAFAFVSRIENGNVIVTAGVKGDLDGPPHILSEAHPGNPMQVVFTRHVGRLSEAGSSIITVRGADQLEHLLREYEKENFAFNVERGVYVPVSNGEVARLKRLELATPDVPPPAANRQFQRIEMICWIGLAVSLFLFTQGEPANAAQAVFRLSILLAFGAGIAIVWLIRGVAWTQRKV
ncbi:MAG TPA: hypothetical protein VMM76_05390 [Pirellulaceae bacterium]|nr:hypothetical protein [Pirellulaceae bacterium]